MCVLVFLENQSFKSHAVVLLEQELCRRRCGRRRQRRPIRQCTRSLLRLRRAFFERTPFRNAPRNAFHGAMMGLELRPGSGPGHWSGGPLPSAAMQDQGQGQQPLRRLQTAGPHPIPAHEAYAVRRLRTCERGSSPRAPPPRPALLPALPSVVQQLRRGAATFVAAAVAVSSSSCRSSRRAAKASPRSRPSLPRRAATAPGEVEEVRHCSRCSPLGPPAAHVIELQAGARSQPRRAWNQPHRATQRPHRRAAPRLPRTTR